MTILYEPNILRIAKSLGIAHMPERSHWNPVGISEDEAKVIAQRHKFELQIEVAEFLPDFRVFVFQDRFVKRNNREGGDKLEKATD